LSELHQIDGGPTPPLATALQLEGVDRRVVWIVSIPVLFWLAAVAALALLHPTAGFGDGLGVALVLLLLATLIAPALALLGRFRAQLVLDEQRIELRYAFGLLRVVLEPALALQSGSLWSRRPVAGTTQDEHSASEDVRVGSYLRISDAGSDITIGSRENTHFRKHWLGARPGPRRRRCDLTLDRLASISLQYELAARRLLEPVAEARR
jgi:hypothetical protein